MAAGIGSRFGQGIKQLTSFGPAGEIIMDYSIFDAAEAGFDRIIFVIRKDLEKDFREIIGDRIAKKVKVDYAFQELTDLPEGFTLPGGRTKPWGTGQAVLACRDLIREPFAVINADDYYGKEAFRLVHECLISPEFNSGNGPEAGEASGGSEKAPMNICMAGFVLENTLSENGGVTRGICSVDQNGILTGIEETKNIIKTEEGAAIAMPDGSQKELDPKARVSMNFWGFPAAMITELQKRFTAFLAGLEDGTEQKAEYLLPTIVDEMLKEGAAKVKVCESHDKWFGVTFHEDVSPVKAAFAKLIENGLYQADLWK